MKIPIDYNKTLKLTNVVAKELDEDGLNNIEREMRLIEGFIKSKGAVPVGPFIQMTSIFINEEGKVDAKIVMMRQASVYIHNMERQYTIESTIKVQNCMYARFIGPEAKINFAYDKIKITAFEEEIDITNDSYTVFVNQNGDELTVDVFVPKK